MNSIEAIQPTTEKAKITRAAEDWNTIATGKDTARESTHTRRRKKAKFEDRKFFIIIGVEFNSFEGRSLGRWEPLFL